MKRLYPLSLGLILGMSSLVCASEVASQWRVGEPVQLSSQSKAQYAGKMGIIAALEPNGAWVEVDGNQLWVPKLDMSDYLIKVSGRASSSPIPAFDVMTDAKYTLDGGCSTDSEDAIDRKTLKTNISIAQVALRNDPVDSPSVRSIYVGQSALKYGIDQALNDRTNSDRSFNLTRDGKLKFGGYGCDKLPAVSPEVVGKYNVYRLSCGDRMSVQNTDATLILDQESGKVVFVQMRTSEAQSSFGPFHFNKKSALGTVSCKDRDLSDQTLRKLIMGQAAYERLESAQNHLQEVMRAYGASPVTTRDDKPSQTVSPDQKSDSEVEQSPAESTEAK